MKINLKFILFQCLLLVAGTAYSTLSPQTAPVKEPEIGIVEHLDEYLPADLVFTDQNNNKVNLKDLINKPTVISFVYFRCPGICSPLMNGMAEVMDKTSDMVLGKDYQAITISFDHTETSDLAFKKRANYLSRMKNPGEKNGWIFLTGDSVNIARATHAIGFNFKKAGVDFLHPGCIYVLSPKAKITRYLRGTYFQPLEFKLALIEASEGKSGSTINKILTFCYNYDPAGQQYVLNVTKVTGTIILFFVVLLFIALLIRSRIKKTNTK
jgi:protein SCO1